MTAVELATYIKGAKETPSGWWQGLCPAHPDTTASLGFRNGTRKLALVCHAGCSRSQILAALHLTEADTWLEERMKKSSSKKPVAIYDYHDEGGKLL